MPENNDDDIKASKYEMTVKWLLPYLRSRKGNTAIIPDSELAKAAKVKSQTTLLNIRYRMRTDQFGDSYIEYVSGIGRNDTEYKLVKGLNPNVQGTPESQAEKDRLANEALFRESVLTLDYLRVFHEFQDDLDTRTEELSEEDADLLMTRYRVSVADRIQWASFGILPRRIQMNSLPIVRFVLLQVMASMSDADTRARADIARWAKALKKPQRVIREALQALYEAGVLVLTPSGDAIPVGYPLRKNNPYIAAVLELMDDEAREAWLSHQDKAEADQLAA